MNSKLSLFEQVKLVNDERSFIEFLEILGQDKQENLSEWKNTEIEDFFECASEWAKVSVDGLKFYEKSENPWTRVAEVLYMGKIYE